MVHCKQFVAGSFWNSFYLQINRYFTINTKPATIWNIWKSRWNTRIWYFDLLEMANKYCDFNATLTRSKMAKICNLQFPKFKMLNRMYMSVLCFTTSPIISTAIRVSIITSWICEMSVCVCPGLQGKFRTEAAFWKHYQCIYIYMYIYIYIYNASNLQITANMGSYTSNLLWCNLSPRKICWTYSSARKIY